MKLQNKILLILIIAFSFILFFNISNVKAVSYDSEHFIEWYNSYPTDSLNGTFRVCADEDFTIDNDNKDRFGSPRLSARSLSTGELITVSLYKNGSYVKDCSESFFEGFYDGETIEITDYAGNVIVYLFLNNERVLFFQAPVVEEPTQGIIAPLLDQQKMEETTLQIRVIIPLIIVVVVSFLGLRKALKMLSQILHRS